MFRAAVADVQRGESAAVIAARFHLAVADLVIVVAERLREQTAITAVALSGGVFLNVLLTRLCTERLQSRDSGCCGTTRCRPVTPGSPSVSW